MLLIVELDGILFDLKHACWHAYGLSVGEIGYARTEEATFWRLLRTGADDGLLVRGAKPRHLNAFRHHFQRHLEADETIALMTPGANLAPALKLLHELGQCSLVTSGANVSARQKLLERHHLFDTLPRLAALSPPVARSATQICELAGDSGRAFVLGAGERIIRAAGEAGLPAVGIAAGSCIAKRLTQCGAAVTFADLHAFAVAHQQGDQRLVDMGLPSARNRPPSTPTRRPDRTADRERRRRRRREGR